MLNAPGNVFGGSTTNAANVISGNHIDGVLLAGNFTANNILQGNLIGTAADGVTSLGNGRYGVWLTGGAHHNTIGADGAGLDDMAEGNMIAFSGLAGIAVESDITIGNSIRGNSIHSNGGLGIDLGADGVTANDEAALDSDIWSQRPAKLSGAAKRAYRRPDND